MPISSASEEENGSAPQLPPDNLPKRLCFTHLDEDLAPGLLLETELMILSLAAGINDATTFPEYRVFASNQTGNTALLAVGALALAPEAVDLPNVAISLSLFVIGGTFLGQLGHIVGRTKRSWLITTNVLQTCLVFVAAALRHWVSTSKHSPYRYFVISLLAFASGGQVAMARTVNVPEITTAMVTSAYIDFFVDPKLLMRKNRSRDRRLFFVLALLIGSFIGAAGYQKVSASFSLLLVGLCKLGVCVLLLFNRAVTPAEERREGTDPIPQAAHSA
ncbi:hypothetical protein H2202_010992 [Exophiala xenobiotica]|uniref:DUF1275 domain protein n=1 Tax=Exophiala oligosperma TaxID=215243 RepID=A0A0D2BFX4_9EURO|nr:uncharacterized protein PV06_11343 [Exophiala oligosperma]KAJ9493523.1 hypothetical protein H2202_010992 [Exophiala xenobiotica]KAK5214709.1 hypothetical protein LTR72_012151 [Exophiala xenobiotica]KAK5250292.1 hypothetical protein LTS06_004870 [Exophiala xenobiotica]KAK5281950.1 hypothetical protein LTR14_012090 [Exophiala xenobiotica]KAK5345751.1 hypothetical protein LTR61_010452 [Exophiala xenobiotica]